MAGLTNFTTGGDNAAMVVSLWGQELLYQAREQIFWDRFSGQAGSNAPIIWNTDLTKANGETVKVDFVSKASGAGVSGTTTLRAAEEEATFYQLDVTVAYKRNAFAVHKADQKKTVHQLSEWGRVLSANWLADAIDNDIFDKLDAQTTNRLYGGAATSKATLTAGDTLTAALISKARAKARSLYIPQINVGGRMLYIMVVSSFAAYDLKQDTTWREAQREAQARGNDNPLLSGMLGIYDGVALFENDRVEIGSDAGAGAVSYAICHLVGGQAVGFAWALPPAEIRDVDDYGARVGIGAEAMWGCAAAVFNSVPIGHIPVMVAAADPTS